MPAFDGSVPFLGHGVGLRVRHYRDLLDGAACAHVDVFEAITENFLHPGGRPRAVLDHIAKVRPIVFHGVGLGIASTAPVDAEYLEAARRLFDRYDPPWVSDHLCFTRAGRHDTHDLLPIPYTEETLNLVTDRIHRVRDAWDRPFCLENVSRYVAHRTSEMDEATFMAELVARTGCGVLLDVNNLLVCEKNLGEDPWRYVEALPRGCVHQIHLAGHTDHGTHAIDDHRGPVPSAVLELYRRVVARFGPVTTIVEWDEDVPPWTTLVAEAERARTVTEEATAP
ncbi:MAG: DUF692 domain-containing protein [Deltaproteobacteria bacterium]|nr:MAG: DUF692 domain-containing protein [Deltaproteobacteria bacterium]